MSNKKLVEHRMRRALNEALASGDNLLAAALTNLLTVYLSGKRDLLGGLTLWSQRVAEMAAQILEMEDHLPALPADRDPLVKKLEGVMTVARAAGLADIAAIMSATSSIYHMKDEELMQKLAEVASSFSSEAVGRRPEKAVLVMDNELGDLGPDPKRIDDDFMENPEA